MRIITLSVYSSLLLNGVMNTHFYPELLRYQGGSTMSEKIKEREIPVDKVYKVSDRFTWSLDFYNKKPVQTISIEELMTMHDIWIYADDKELEQLENEGFHWHDKISVDQFRITRLQLKFLNPHTRPKVLNQMHLLYLD